MIFIEDDRTKEERTEASRPVDYTEYQQALAKGKPIDVMRLKTDTCPEDTRDLYILIQKEKQRRR